MEFKRKQTIVVVSREKFYESLKSGSYRLATIKSVQKDSEGRTYYVAEDPFGNEYSNIIGGPWEFDSIDYIKSVLLRLAEDAKSEAAFLYERAASLDAWLWFEGRAKFALPFIMQ